MGETSFGPFGLLAGHQRIRVRFPRQGYNLLMTVEKLIEFLKTQNPKAKVYAGTMYDPYEVKGGKPRRAKKRLEHQRGMINSGDILLESTFGGKANAVYLTGHKPKKDEI